MEAKDVESGLGVDIIEPTPPSPFGPHPVEMAVDPACPLDQIDEQRIDSPEPGEVPGPRGENGDALAPTHTPP